MEGILADGNSKLRLTTQNKLPYERKRGRPQARKPAPQRVASTPVGQILSRLAASVKRPSPWPVLRPC